MVFCFCLFVCCLRKVFKPFFQSYLGIPWTCLINAGISWYSQGPGETVFSASVHHYSIRYMPLPGTTVSWQLGRNHDVMVLVRHWCPVAQTRVLLGSPQGLPWVWWFPLSWPWQSWPSGQRKSGWDVFSLSFVIYFFRWS